MTTQAETTQKDHDHAVRFFWGLLIGATTVSLLGNVAHAVLPYLPRVVIQVGAAAVPPLVLLAAVHGIAVAVRAGVSGTVYRCAVSAVAVIGVGAFTVSFLALRDLMLMIGYGAQTAWIFPAIIDTAVAVSTLMLVALGDKPARRVRTSTSHSNASRRVVQYKPDRSVQGAKSHVTAAASAGRQVERAQDLTQNAALGVDADLAAELIASGVTTQPIETVIAVVSAHSGGASINAAAKESGINYRTAQRIIGAAEGRHGAGLVAAR